MVPFSYGFPMVFPWFSYGFPMVFGLPPLLEAVTSRRHFSLSSQANSITCELLYGRALEWLQPKEAASTKNDLVGLNIGHSHMEHKEAYGSYGSSR